MSDTKIESVKIEWFTQKQNLSEIYSSGMQYSLVNQDGKQCCPFCHCKDYFQDAVWATLHGKSTSIYGFSFDPATNPPLDMENTRMLLTNSKDNKFLEKIENMLDFINQVEDIFDFRNTTAKVVENPEAKYKTCGIIETCSSHRWMRSPVLLSIYTLLLRVGFSHTKGNNWQDTIKGMISGKIAQYQTNDKGYLQQSIEGLEYILKAGYKNIFYVQPKFNYPEKADVNSIHNRSGIVAFSSMVKGEKSLVKHWTRADVKELVKSSDKSFSFK